MQEDCGYYFIKRQGLFRKTAGTAGSILEKGRGSFAKLPAEGVSSNLGR